MEMMQGKEPRERLLIVDDEPVVLELLTDILGAGPFEIVTAATVGEAIAGLEEEPALAIIDKNLPDGSGLAILYALRKRWPMSEAIVFTGYASYESAVDALRLGAYDYIGKPLRDIEEMRRKVFLALERRRFRVEREQTLAQLQEAQRLQSYAAHAQVMAQLGRMLAGIVHDLRSPLTYVRGNVEATLLRIRDREGLDREKAALKDALAGCDQLAAMTGDIRRVAGVDAYARERREAVTIEDVVRNAVNLTSSTTRHRCEVEVTHAEPGAKLLGSPVRLTQVFMNLILNASEAIEDKGTIKIRSALREGRLRIEVEDDGRGIDQDAMAHLFEPFFTTKAASGGTGLGLALSLEIAREHGGTLTVRANPTRGTTFLVDLPAMTQAREQVA